VGLLASVAAAEVSEQARSSIDRVIGHKGTYIPEEDVYKITLPKEAATIVQDYQTLSPNLGLNSWVAFSSGVHHDAVLTGQFLLLDDEVNPVLDIVLESGLDVTGLADSCSFDSPHVHTMDITGLGTFPTLASAFRKGLDAMQHVQQATAVSPKRASKRSIPIESVIDPGPLDAILSMKGTVMAGVYKAAIGKRTLLNGELVGREMGMSTWVSVAGTNGHAFAQGEFVESPNGLRKLLTALRARGMNISAIRNHTVGEHPQSIFVRFWGEGTAIQLAKAVRYALDVEVGAVSPGSGRKI
jgi:hypothetical protein